MTHRHTASYIKFGGTSLGCVCSRGGRCNKLSHDGLVTMERCDCGYVRWRNNNGQHVERSPWKYPEGDIEDELPPWPSHILRGLRWVDTY